MGFELEEISGITYYGPNLLACVQDEEGKLYLYDLIEKEVRDRIKFGKGGDYEGVEVAAGKAYVLKSNGQLYEFTIGDVEELSINKLSTPLTIGNDTEGLGYDPASGHLLIACKAKGEIGEGKVKGKSVYAFDLEQRELIKVPLFTIRKKDIEKYLKKQDRKHKDIDFHPLQGFPTSVVLAPHPHLQGDQFRSGR